MRTSSGLAALLLAVMPVVGGALNAAGNAAARGQTTPPPHPAEPIVTPVSGPSWLHRLNIGYGESSLGRGAGRYGPAPGSAPPISVGTTSVAGHPTTLSGQDLYRLNCQACHRAEGTGAPPEIKSILDLVRGSSLELLRGQLDHKETRADAATLKAQADAARTALYRRIAEGGQRMPPLAHLQKNDIDTLYTYVARLANVPDAGPESFVNVSWARLGENLVKGTCHICHDAAGPRPNADQLLGGAIPPLSVLVAENARAGFITKARYGAPVTMGHPSFHYRGRMPVFYYLRDEELAAAYDFLASYAPQH